LLDRRYREIKDFELASVTDQIPLWFSMETSDSFEERRSTIGELPIWDAFKGNLEYARFFEQYNAVATHIVFTQGLRWTREMMDDDLTGIMRGDRYRKMVRAATITRQIHAARLWNFAASNDSYFYSRSEGVPLASASHTTRADGVSTATGFNNITVAELAPTSYRALRQQMRRFANDRGYITNIIPDTLVVPIELEQRAMEIQDSPGDADTARRSSNPEGGTAGIQVPLYWTSTQNWALVNTPMMHENVIWFDHTKPDFKSIIDFETFQLKASGYGRWSWMALDWRWLGFANVA
jgi:hypothetical protein